MRRARPAAWFALFALPALVLLVLTRLAPELFSLGTSLNRARPALLGGDEFTGLDNYVALFTDPEFGAVLLRTLLFVAVLDPVMIVLALILAQALTRRFALRGVLRAFVMVPSFIPIIGVSILLGSGVFAQRGLINSALAAIGLPAQPFLASPDQAIVVIGLIALWVGAGYWMIFFIAGMNDIPESYYEAAALDGAGEFRQWWSVTLPLMRGQILFVLVANTVWLFELYAPVQYLTRGGPQGSTELLIFVIVRQATEYSDQPLAMTMMVVLLVLLIVAVSLQFRVLGDRDVKRVIR